MHVFSDINFQHICITKHPFIKMFYPFLWGFHIGQCLLTFFCNVLLVMMYIDHNDYDYDSIILSIDSIYYPWACSSLCLLWGFYVTDIICEDNMDTELAQNLLFSGFSLCECVIRCVLFFIEKGSCTLHLPSCSLCHLLYNFAILPLSFLLNLRQWKNCKQWCL